MSPQVADVSQSLECVNGSQDTLDTHYRTSLITHNEPINTVTIFFKKTEYFRDVPRINLVERKEREELEKEIVIGRIF